MRSLATVSAVCVAVTLAAVASGALGSTGQRAYVRCENSSGAGTTPAFRPRGCVFVRAGSPTQPFGYEQAIVVRLHWARWGASTTTASGTFEGNMDFRAAATVQLSRLRFCTPGKSVYTRLLLTIHATGETPSREALGGC